MLSVLFRFTSFLVYSWHCINSHVCALFVNGHRLATNRHVHCQDFIATHFVNLGSLAWWVVHVTQIHTPPLTSSYPGLTQSCPFVNMLCLLNRPCTYMYKRFVFVSTPVHVYGLSGRCWTAILVDFNAYWAALPTNGWHILMEGCKCKVREALNGQQFNKGTKSWQK